MSFGIDIYSGWRAIRTFILEPLCRLLHPVARLNTPMLTLPILAMLVSTAVAANSAPQSGASAAQPSSDKPWPPAGVFRFGLDDAAIKSLKEYRFTPGTRDGVPVPVLLSFEVSFSVRK